MSPLRFSGKTAIVTGSSGEIGRATTLALASEGAGHITGAVIDVNGGRFMI